MAIADSLRHGFRDAIIVETFIQLIEESPHQPQRCRIVLLTNDGLLAEAVAKRVANRDNVKILTSADELSGLINTLMSTVPEDYIARIQLRARDYFLKDPEHNTGLFYDLDVRAAIENQCKAQLEQKPADSDRRSNGTWFVAHPRFVKKERQRLFWASRLTIDAKGYKRVQPPLPAYETAITSGFVNLSSSGLDKPRPASLTFGSRTSDAPSHYVPAGLVWSNPESYGPAQTKTYTIGSVLSDDRLVATGKTIVDVNWSVSVSVNGVFSKPRIESVEFVETIWETAG